MVQKVTSSLITLACVHSQQQCRLSFLQKESLEQAAAKFPTLNAVVAADKKVHYIVAHTDIGSSVDTCAPLWLAVPVFKPVYHYLCPPCKYYQCNMWH